MAIFYTLFFIARRVLTVIVLMFMKDYSCFQSSLLMVFSLINLAYIVEVKPFTGKLENVVEIINELTIYLNQLMFT